MPISRNFSYLTSLIVRCSNNVPLLVHQSVLRYNFRSVRSQSSNNEKNVKKMLDNATVNEESMPEENNWFTSPYPKGVNIRDQSAHSLRPKVDPAETTIIVFPGQGVQYVGMGKNLLKFPTVHDLFKAASEIVKYDVLKLCLNGPDAKLNRTDYQQVAVFTCSIAALEALKEEQPSVVENCIATAGFSLGEITALTFAEVFSFEQAIKLVKVRAEAMQIASEMEEGAMLTIFFGPDASLGEACKKAIQHASECGVENPYCAVSNYLFPHCKIVAGHIQAIEFIEKNKEEFKLKKMRRLPVSGAFHTSLMQPAVEPFRSSLNRIEISEPSIAVHSNVDGKRYNNVAHIKRQLPKQITAPVKWEQTLHIMYERPKSISFPRTFECGPGKSLSTILKMVNGKAWETCYNIPA